MPLRYFSCPNGERIAVADCLNKCCRPEGRCLSLPTLIAVGKDRPWTGKPSTTQLINGTRLSYLQITESYTVNPFGRAFALLGTRHHQYLEAVATRLNALSEEKLEGDVSGILDLLTVDEMADHEAYELWDYKTSGSFKVAKALGLVGRKIPDPMGEVYKKSGNWGKAGEVKIVTVYERDPLAVDMWDWELQLNHYRIKIEACGFPVSKMTIQATVRDGGTMVAKNRGVNINIYLIPVKRLDDLFIRNYFEENRRLLLTALESHRLPSPCSAKERWDGKRCESYCDVWEFCDVGMEAHRRVNG